VGFVSVYDIGVLWLNAYMDQFGFWCECYHTVQLFCMRRRSGSARGKGDLPGCDVLGLQNFLLSLLSFEFRSAF